MNPNHSALLLTALATGLAGSAHCLSMCGSINATLSLNTQHKRHLPSYHLGRLLSYTLLGSLLGLILPFLGLTLHQPKTAHLIRQLTSLLIIATGLYLLFDLTLIRRLERYGLILWKPLARLTQSLLPIQSHSDALLIGLLWGLLPCGLIYTALALAISSANPLIAALIMLSFGIGTLPAMLSISLFSGIILRTLAHSYGKKTLGLFIIALGSWTLFALRQP